MMVCFFKKHFRSFLLMFLFIFAANAVSAQINKADSTVQVVAYWSKGEKQIYDLEKIKYKIKGTDTTKTNVINCRVAVTVLDSTANSYTIEWKYLYCKSSENNELYQKLNDLSKDVKFIYKISELGDFAELLNWEEISAFYREVFKKISKDISTEKPEVKQLIKNLENSFCSREYIESAAIKDIQQFHFFHGIKVKLGEEITNKIPIPFPLTGSEIETDLTLFLDEIIEEDDNYIIRCRQIFDSEALKKVMGDYIDSLTKSMGAKKDFEFSKDMKVSGDIYTSALIHDSGWLVYGIHTTTMDFESSVTIEENTIEIVANE